MQEFRQQYESRLSSRQRKQVTKGLAKAQTRDSMQEVGKLTHLVDGRPRIISDPPLLVPLDELLAGQAGREFVEAELSDLVGKYRRTLETDRRYLLDQYEFADMAHKVVGVGSVGTRCWIVLMLGRDDATRCSCRSRRRAQSVLGRYVGASKYANQGQRVVAGQRLMQASSDIFLGWQRTEVGLTASPRLLHPPAPGLEASVDIDCDDRRTACACTASCAAGRWPGRTPGPATASPSPPTSAARHVFDQAIAEFAGAYADQNERDHHALVERSPPAASPRPQTSKFTR